MEVGRCLLAVSSSDPHSPVCGLYLEQVCVCVCLSVILMFAHAQTNKHTDTRGPGNKLREDGCRGRVFLCVLEREREAWCFLQNTISIWDDYVMVEGGPAVSERRRRGLSWPFRSSSAKNSSLPECFPHLAFCYQPLLPALSGHFL